MSLLPTGEIKTVTHPVSAERLSPLTGALAGAAIGAGTGLLAGVAVGVLEKVASQKS